MVGDRLLAMRSNEERGGVVVNGDEGEGSSILVGSRGSCPVTQRRITVSPPWHTNNKVTHPSTQNTASLHAIRRRALSSSPLSLDSQLDPGPATLFGLTVR